MYHVGVPERRGVCHLQHPNYEMSYYVCRTALGQSAPRLWQFHSGSFYSEVTVTESIGYCAYHRWKTIFPQRKPFTLGLLSVHLQEC